MIESLLPLLIGFILFGVVGIILLPISIIFIASFLATTKTLGYVWGIIVFIVGYFITLINFFCYAIGLLENTAVIFLPIPASITLALLIFALTMVYEKVRYHEIFYPYDGD